MCTSGCSASSRTARRPNANRALADRISETMDFMAAIGITPENNPSLRET